MSSPKLVFDSCLVRLPSNIKRMGMKCPHCLIAIHYEPIRNPVCSEERGRWLISNQACPACKKQIIYLELVFEDPVGSKNVLIDAFLAYPRDVAREALSPEVPEEFAGDYREACAIPSGSPKASAALSRRCLQHLIREKAGITRKNLFNEIQDLINSSQLPGYLADGIDAVRQIGNFAAHPMKSTNTGEILDVEAGEAEWLLEILEGLFDFYFVQPAELKRRKDALNKKLTEAGKNPMP